MVSTTNLGMMLANIEEMNRIESIVNVAFNNESRSFTKTQAIDLIVNGDFVANSTDPVLEFDREAEFSQTDGEGFTIERYEELIQTGKQFIEQSRGFKQPIYSNLIPCLFEHIENLEREKQQKFPLLERQYQSTINQFIHYQQ